MGSVQMQISMVSAWTHSVNTSVRRVFPDIAIMFVTLVMIVMTLIRVIVNFKVIGIIASSRHHVVVWAVSSYDHVASTSTSSASSRHFGHHAHIKASSAT